MKIQVNTDNNITNTAKFTEEVENIVEAECEFYKSRLSRIEVYLKDENSTKGGDDDKKCSLEARIEGMKPVGVSHHAGTLRDAVVGACEKLTKVLKTTFEKLESKN